MRARPGARRSWLVTVALCTTVLTVPALPASAAPVGTPIPPAATSSGRPQDLAVLRTQARELREDVDRLERETAVAVEDHNAAQVLLASLVSRHLSAQDHLGEAQGQQAAVEAQGNRRVRALYMSGGSAALYAGLLGDGDIADVLRRTQTVRSLVRGDHAALTSVGAGVAQAEADTAELDRLSAEQRVARIEVEAAAERVVALLAENQERLTRTSAAVQRLATEERDRITAEGEAAASRFLADAAAAREDGSAPPSTLPAPSEAAALAVEAALSQLGDPYQWGATGPGSFDCSGLMQWSYRQAGVALPRVSRDQWRSGPRVGVGDLAPGDLVFHATDTSDPATIYHVGMYIGDGQLVVAPQTGEVVRRQPVRLTNLLGAVRPTGTGGTGRGV